jgi:hypothetical protein
MHEDANTETVIKEIVRAIKEGARLIGKADRRVEVAQFDEVQEAIGLLRKTLDLKRKLRATRT